MASTANTATPAANNAKGNGTRKSVTMTIPGSTGGPVVPGAAHDEELPHYANAGRRRALVTATVGPNSKGNSPEGPGKDGKKRGGGSPMMSPYAVEEEPEPEDPNKVLLRTMLAELKKPVGLKQKPLEKDIKLDEVEERLLGMPGQLSLDYATSQKYFGSNARDKFFDRYKWLNRQRNITSTRPEEPLEELYFENEKTNSFQAVAFGPIRSNNRRSNADDDQSEMESKDSSTSFMSRFKGTDSSQFRDNERRRLRESYRRSGFLEDDIEEDIDDFDEERMLQELASIRRKEDEAMEYLRDEEDDHEAPQSPAKDAYVSTMKPRIRSPSPEQIRDTYIKRDDLLETLESGKTFIAIAEEEKKKLEKSFFIKTTNVNSKEPPKKLTTKSSFSIPPPPYVIDYEHYWDDVNAAKHENDVMRLSTGPTSEISLMKKLERRAEKFLSGERPSTASATRSTDKATTATKDYEKVGAHLTAPKGYAKPTARRPSSAHIESKAALGKDFLLTQSTPKASIRGPSLGAASPTAKATNRPRTASHSSSTTNSSTVKKLEKVYHKKKKLGKKDARSLKKRLQEEDRDHSEDLYSSMILEDILLRKNIVLPEMMAESISTGPSGSLTISESKKRMLDDESVFTAETISTLGLFEATATISGEGISRGTIDSPRTKYLTGCMKEGLNPRASLVLRKHMTKQLNLQHHGMGDKMAALLAEVLRTLPYIQAINIADNMLTDDGMGPIILAAEGMPNLLELNLSMNEIGPISAKSLFEYLVSPTCPLERLILNSADVDDFECGRFVEAIKINKSLKELDLSKNKIGTAENLNTVMPDIITGGEALADLLRHPDCHLLKLKLDWNMIRLDGAIDLANSISVNTTLRYLDLSFNSLSTDGGVTLGVSLLKNRTLETLILSNNSIDAIAAFTICAGVIENRGLKKVVLDGNPIGEQGMRALLLVPLLAGNRVKVSAAKCNVTIRDSRCWFDFDKLIREYRLNMNEGFDRAIAIILLHLIAGHPSYIFTKFQHETPPVGKKQKAPKLKNLELVQMASRERMQYFDAKQKSVLDSLERVKAAASDIQMAIKFFQEVDEDGSGELDKQELGNLMTRMGLKLSEKRLDELMRQYDVDAGGRIEIHEFLMLLKSQHKDAIERIRELCEMPVMALKGENVQYLPPENGFLNITVIDGFAKKAMYRILSSCDREYLEEVTRDIGGSAASNMATNSLQGVRLRLDEALTIAEGLLQDSQDKVGVIKKLILSMNSSDDARHFINSLLDGDRTGMMRLKREMGAALRPLLGNPNGYYILDLAKEMDRMCLEKLLEISTTLGERRKESSKIGFGRVGDMSQKGNFSSFRNEIFEKNPVTITPAFAAPMPFSGKLEFDFSGTPRPPKDVLAISDMRVVKLLMTNHLLDQKDCAVALQRLREAKLNAEKTLRCDGNNYYECDMERAMRIAEFVEQFYLNNHLRMKQFEEALEKESSTEVDDKGNLLTLFERDKYPMPLLVSDYFIRQEQKEKEREDKLLAEKRAAEEKAAKAAERHYLNGVVKNVPHRGSVANVPAQSEVEHNEIPTDTESESGEEDDERADSPELSHPALMALKVHETMSDDEEVINEPKTEKEVEWQKEFEMLKMALMKPKEVKKAPSLGNIVKRNNIFGSTNHLQLPIDDEFIEKFRLLLISPQLQVGAKAHRIIDMVEDLFARSWIYCRHLALMVECFAQYGYYKQTKYFGTYRVDMIISVFHRLLDVHNFEFVMEVLSPYEVACLYCRLGWLNLYNPCKPEGSWELDMSRREERVIAKTLCVLATHEPGDNWIYETFRWMRTMESMPGWELTQPWLTEDGMPMRGLLNVTYYSGEGKKLRGCRPYISFRKSLLNLVLINEDEIVAESLRSKPTPAVMPGDRAFAKHQQLWETYLAPEFVDPNRKR